MAVKAFKRPDETAMLRLLEDNKSNTVGVILRLAWKLALRREEMHGLVWSDLDLTQQELTLPGRRTPVDEETCAVLRERFAMWGAVSEYVVISDRHHAQMQPQSISRVARQALDACGQAGISLEDLRQDCIIRLLRERGVSYTARFSGIAVNTLYTNYSQYLSKEKPAGKRPPAEVDEFALWQVMQKEGASPAGLIMWMVWQLGMSVTEALALTWAQTDLEAGVLRLEGRQVATGTAFGRLLRQVRESRPPDADPHVLLSPRAQKPYDAPGISKLTKTVLLRGGVEGVTLETLGQMRRWKGGDDELLRRAEKNGCVTRNEVMALLSASPAQAYERLRRLTEQGRLVKVGARYYPAGSVVPPEEQFEAIRAYLEEAGGAYRQELADLLHLEARQCSWILRGLVEEGKLTKTGQRYLLSEESAENG